MVLKNLVPFLNYRLCDDIPGLFEVLAHEIQEFGLGIHKTDVASIAELEEANIIYTRIPLLLHATADTKKEKASAYFLRTLKSKFLTAITIEGKPEDLPALIAEEKNALNIWIERSENQTVREVTRLVYKEIHNAEFSVKLIGEKLHISRQSLQKVFHKAGLSRGVWEYVLDLRMHEAARIMRESNLPLKEISAIYGYREYDSFSKRFKKVFGFPPRDVRKMNVSEAVKKP